MDPRRTRKAQKGDAQRQHTKAPVSGGDAPTRHGSPRALSGGGGGGKSATSPHTLSEAMEKVLERKANSVLFTPPNTSTPRGRSQQRETTALHRERTPVAAKKNEEPEEARQQRRRSETPSREPSPCPPTPPARARSPSPSSFLDELFGTLPDDDEEPARGTSPVRTDNSRSLLKEWSRIPKNFHLPTFESRRDDVLDFLEAMEHTFDVWGIQEDCARIKFMWAQCRDTTSRVWFKEHMDSFDYNSFCKEFVRRFASHTARRDALKSLRDIRQTGDPRGFVTAFERVMENLTRFGLHIDQEELIIFIQLAVTDSVRDGLDWSLYKTAHDALTKIASLSSARPRDDSHHSNRPRNETHHSRDTPARKTHAPETKHAPHKDRNEDRRPGGTFQRDGDRRCFSCGSDQHLRADCPHQPAGVPFNKGNGHRQGNGPRPRRF